MIYSKLRGTLELNAMSKLLDYIVVFQRLWLSMKRHKRVSNNATPVLSCRG